MTELVDRLAYYVDLDEDDQPEIYERRKNLLAAIAALEAQIDERKALWDYEVRCNIIAQRSITALRDQNAELEKDKETLIYWLRDSRLRVESLRRVDAIERELNILLVEAGKTPIPGTGDEVHRELRCERCHREHTVWCAPNDLWNRVVQGEEFLCMDCFAILAEERGVRPTAWVITEEQLRPDTGDTAALDELLRNFDVASVAFDKCIAAPQEERWQTAIAAIHAHVAAVVQAERETMQHKIDHLRAAGHQLSNIAFNLAQREVALTSAQRATLKRCQQDWDAAAR